MDNKIDRELNLKGVICPYNFIKAKLAMEEMPIGAVLKVIIDYPTAIEDVPRGMEYEGQEILAKNKLNATDWEIIIRKKK